MNHYILFIVTSYWAYGELTIALEFAKRIQVQYYKPIFIIPPSHVPVIKSYNFLYSTLIPKSPNINRLLLKDIQDTYSPVLIILSDFLNYSYCEQQYGLTIEDLKVFRGKVGTFDNFDWESTHNSIDTYGLYARRHGMLGLEKYAFRLQPCPLNAVATPAYPSTYRYSLFKAHGRQEQYVRQVAREKLNLNAKRLLLLTTAQWQKSFTSYPRVNHFIQTCTKLLEHVIRKLGPDIMTVAIGPSVLFQEGNIPAHFEAVDQVPPPLFDIYLMASDLFVTNNIASTTFHRAVLRGIPSIALFNSLHKDDRKTNFSGQFPSSARMSPYSWQLFFHAEYLYPFHMFPVGWYYFLQPILQNNDFAEIFQRIEIFDEYKILDTLNTLLYDVIEREKMLLRVERYQNALSSLPSVDTIVNSILAE